MVQQIEAFKPELQTRPLAQKLAGVPWQVPVLGDGEIYVGRSWPCALAWPRIGQPAKHEAIVCKRVGVDALQPVTCKAGRRSLIRTCSKRSGIGNTPGITARVYDDTRVRLEIAGVIDAPTDRKVWACCYVHDRASLPISGNRPQERISALQLRQRVHQAGIEDVPAIEICETSVRP